jgi:hypothetical protein
MANADKKAKTAREYEQLGRLISSVYESGYLDKKQSYKTSFIKGVFSGFGGVVGATVVVGVLLWVLSLFGSVPLIGRFTDRVEQTVQQTTNK